MSMYLAHSDRDHAEAVYGPHRGSFQKRVPCVLCRAPVWVETRGHSLFARDVCDGCRQDAAHAQDLMTPR